MKRYLVFALMLSLTCAFAACSKTITSEGDNLDPVKAEKETAGEKVFAYTLDQINIEGDSTGPYVRLFDTNRNTMFLYVPKDLVNKVLNLERNKKYIYQFTIRPEKYGLRGDLKEVADLEGKLIAKDLKDPTLRPEMVVLEHAAAKGKSYTMELMFTKKAVENDKKRAQFQADTPNRTTVFCNYTDDMDEKVDALEANKKYKVQFKVDYTDWRIFSDLVSVE